MQSPDRQWQVEFQEMLNQDEEVLLLRLGVEMSRNAAALVAKSGLEAPDELLGGSAKERGSEGFLKRMSRRFVDNLSTQFYELICNPDDEENKKVRTWLNTGTDVAIGALAVYLGSFLCIGLIPARLLAGILFKRVTKSGMDALCETWKERLPASKKAAAKKDAEAKPAGK